MCCTKGEDGVNAFKTFEAVIEIFCADEIPYENYVSLSVDNTSTMTGVNNSIVSRFKEKNGNILITGCPCHVAHITAKHANDSFSNVVRFNAENFVLIFFIGSIKVLKERES